MTTIRIAFLALTDAAPPIVAREKGFAEVQGIILDLVRDTSWATGWSMARYRRRTCWRRWLSR